MEGRGDELSDVLAAHLGADAWSLPAASRSWPPYEHVNVQTGVEQWLARNASEQRLIGLVGFRHRMFGLVDLCQPGGEQGLRVGGVATVEMAAGPDELTHPCVQCGLYLVRVGEARADLVLPEGVLEGVEQHIHGVARHHDLLLAHGLHVKRGALLYGAPGTGKTHTVRYLTSLLPDTTVVVLSGSALRYIAEARALARDLQDAGG